MADDEDGDPVVPVDEDAEMRITDVFSYNDGLSIIQEKYKEEFDELLTAVQGHVAEEVFTKETKEARLSGKLLASPGVMNHLILVETLRDEMGWAVDHAAGRNKKDIRTAGYEPRSCNDDECALDIQPGDPYSGKRSIDAVKNKFGVEVQYGKYAFLMYDVLAKFAHMNRAGRVNAGVEIVPSRKLIKHMSSGVGNFDQLRAELEHLPEDYINEKYRIPLVAIGIGFEEEPVNLDKIQDEALYYSQSKMDTY